jgi:hypothetical protein
MQWGGSLKIFWNNNPGSQGSRMRVAPVQVWKVSHWEDILAEVLLCKVEVAFHTVVVLAVFHEYFWLSGMHSWDPLLYSLPSLVLSLLGLYTGNSILILSTFTFPTLSHLVHLSLISSFVTFKLHLYIEFVSVHFPHLYPWNQHHSQVPLQALLKCLDPDHSSILTKCYIHPCLLEFTAPTRCFR